MLRVFDRSGREIVTLPEDPVSGWAEAAWFDLQSPTPEEEARVEAAIGAGLPTRDELRDIEPSSRLYTENGALYLTASLVCKSDTASPSLADVGFIVAGDKLVTVRYAEPRAFAIFTASLGRTHDCAGGADILSRLLETIVDRTAEILEHASRTTDEVTLRVFHTEVAERRPDRATRDLEATLSRIALLQRLVAKARESLMSLSRVSAYLNDQPAFRDDKAIRERVRSVARDVQSLSQHADFIAGNIIFLLDASLGLITVQQNTVMKIFSIAAVVLLPPTLIGSIYGMNFEHMPELATRWGYPAALVAMLLTAVLPFVWFRKKGWL